MFVLKPLVSRRLYHTETTEKAKRRFAGKNNAFTVFSVISVISV